MAELLLIGGAVAIFVYYEYEKKKKSAGRLLPLQSPTHSPPVSPPTTPHVTPPGSPLTLKKPVSGGSSPVVPVKAPPILPCRQKKYGLPDDFGPAPGSNEYTTEAQCNTASTAMLDEQLADEATAPQPNHILGYIPNYTPPNPPAGEHAAGPYSCVWQ